MLNNHQDYFNARLNKETFICYAWHKTFILIKQALLGRASLIFI